MDSSPPKPPTLNSIHSLYIALKLLIAEANPTLFYFIIFFNFFFSISFFKFLIFIPVALFIIKVTNIFPQSILLFLSLFLFIYFIFPIRVFPPARISSPPTHKLFIAKVAQLRQPPRQQLQQTISTLQETVANNKTFFFCSLLSPKPSACTLYTLLQLIANAQSNHIYTHANFPLLLPSFPFIFNCSTHSKTNDANCLFQIPEWL